MRLTELEPEFVARTEHGFKPVATPDEADGIWFLCPVCFRKNNGPVGTHHILCWRPRVPAGITPGPGRWELQGSSFDDLSLVSSPTSVDAGGGCHFTVAGGQITIYG